MPSHSISIFIKSLLSIAAAQKKKLSILYRMFFIFIEATRDTKEIHWLQSWLQSDGYILHSEVVSR